MRILKIELQNINSLKSNHPIVIDFESDLFKDVGLYAITGSTGAGKTTILDAITIAMYHSVPRFNSTTAKANLLDVVSYGANEAMARVSFENQGKRYEAHWSMRLTTKGGKLLSNPKEEVRLKDLSTGKIIAEKKNEVKIEVERVTQLNYHQFLRSAMLAQGEFAAFLSASSKDKGKLLEQITGEDIYKKIGETIGSKIAAERRKLEEVRAKINADDLLSLEQRNELKEEQELLEKELEKRSEELKGVERILDWYKRKNTVLKEQERLIEQSKLLEQEKQSKQEIIEALNKHEKAEPYKELLDKITRLEKELEKNKARLLLLEESVKELFLKIGEAKKQEDKLKLEYQHNEDLFTSWLPKLDLVTKHDSDAKNGKEKKLARQTELTDCKLQISKLQAFFDEKNKSKEANRKELGRVNEFLEKNKNALQLEKQLGDWRSDLSIRKRNYEQAQAEKKELIVKEKILSDTQTALKATLEKYEKEQTKLVLLDEELKKVLGIIEANPLSLFLGKREDLDKQKIAWKEGLRLSLAAKDLLAQEIDLNSFQDTLTKECDTLTKKHQNILLKKTAADSALKDAERILELEGQILSFDEERKKLLAGEPCHLCGAIEHPYVSEYQNRSLSKSKAEREERKKVLDLVSKEEKDIELSLVANKTKREANGKTAKTLEEQLKKTCADFKSLQLDAKMEATESCAQYLADLEKQSAALQLKITQIQALQKKKDLQDVTCKKQTNLVSELKTKQATLSEKKENTASELKQKRTAVEKLNAEIKDLESKLFADLATYKLVLPLVEETAAFVLSVEKQIATYHAKAKEQVELKNSLNQSLNDLNNNREQFSEKQKSKLSLENDLKEIELNLEVILGERKAILPLQISVVEKRAELQKTKETTQKAYDSASKFLHTLNTEQHSKTKERENLLAEQGKTELTWKAQLVDLEKVIGLSDFESRAAVENVLLTLEEKNKFSKVAKQIEDSSLKLNALGVRLQEDLEQLEQQKNFKDSADEAAKKQKDLEFDKNKQTERKGEIRQKFELDQQIKDRNQSVTIEIAKQEQVLKKWTDLMTLLGGSKDAFNTYVQRLTLHNLIQLANVHLFKLNKRYSLKLDDTYKANEELLFKLIDHYQTDEARYVDTSSGGEKFIISLALALGLSDLASNNVSIDSLFIDEGFGTLDSQTLETVISSLETLQAQGKMIGIISHVENLKERIPAQIRVQKKSNGVSEVELL